MLLRITACLIFILPASVFAQALQPGQITLAIIHDDGGKSSERHLGNFLDALRDKGCHAIPAKETSIAPAQLVFDPAPVSIARKQRSDYQLIAKAKALDGSVKVRGAIVVHAATGVKDLELLKGKWTSFVSKASWPGYRLPIALLNEAGVNKDNTHFYFVGNHIGAVAALLHKDVHVAVLAEPLAKRWAEQNQLSIVAVTDEVETGGWWIHHTVSDNILKQCLSALTSLNRSQHKVVPAWIDGFAEIN